MEDGRALKRNKLTFGLGTIGRDMTYTLVSMYLIYYITEIVGVTDAQLLVIGAVMVCARVFDALNDPFMGVVVDNTHTRWGKFKPWIAFGAVASGILTVVLFADFHLSGTAFVAVFGIVYVLWGMAYTTNDISYWSMMPSLSSDQKEREKLGAAARICANIGLFVVVGGIIPVTTAIGESVGDMKQAYFIFAAAVAIILVAGQAITLFGVREPRKQTNVQKTDIKGMLRAIFKNDQLLWTAISMALFMIGYNTTTSFGTYYFKYAYGDEGMYPIFAVILGITQITALSVFPLFSRHFSRKQLYAGATVAVFAGYTLFFFAPMNIIIIGIAGVFLFAGQAFIQLLMLVFLADTIEYGEWKLGTRNESVSFSLQPFINKMGGAVASGIVSVTLVISGINGLKDGEAASAEGLFIMKIAMLAVPLLLIVIGFLIYKNKFKIDKELFDRIVRELGERGKSSEQ